MTGSDADLLAVGPTSGLRYVHLTEDMADQLAELELLSFPTASTAELYHADEFVALASDFPEGTVVGFDERDSNRPVAAGLGVRSHFDFAKPQHDLETFFDDAPTESGDDPDGEWYYGTDIIVHPDYRRRGIGRELYDLRKQICGRLGLAGIVAGGVIPGYAEQKTTMSADAYIDEVRAGRLYDPTLTFQLENGFEALCALAGYLTDPAVDSWASLIVWHNPDHRPSTETIP